MGWAGVVSPGVLGACRLSAAADSSSFVARMGPANEGLAMEPDLTVHGSDRRQVQGLRDGVLLDPCVRSGLRQVDPGH